MLGFLTRNRYWPIALDIGTESIRMLQLHRVGNIISVNACSQWQFPRSASQDVQQRRQLMVPAVREMFRSAPFKGRRVVSALSCDQVTIKNVRLPHMPEHEMAEAIKWEAKERFGYDPQRDQIAFLNAGQVRSGNETRDELIILTVPQQETAAHLEMLNAMGLLPEHIEVQPMAMFRVFERWLRRRADEQAVSVIADIGRSATRVIVARGRDIVFIKSIDIGGEKFSESVARQLGLELVEADELRLKSIREHGDKPHEEGREADLDWTLHDAIRGEVETLAREISLCLRYCAVTFRGLRPEKIMVTGGEAYDPSVLKLLNEHMHIECLVGQPLRGMDVSAVDLGGDRRASLVEWTTCAGLAMRNIDFAGGIKEVEHGEHRLSA